jgi:hypothetical protein
MLEIVLDGHGQLSTRRGDRSAMRGFLSLTG